MKISLAGNSYVKLGLQTFWGVRLEAPFERAKQLKMGAVEIFFDKKGPHGFMPSDLKRDAREAVRGSIEDGVEVSVHAPLLDFEGKTWKIELADTMAFCGDIGRTSLTVHPPIEQPSALKEMAKIFSGFTERTEVLFENTPDFRMPSLLDRYVMSLSDMLGREIGVTFDTGHANLSGMTPRRYMEGLKSKIKHLHIHDNRRNRDEHLSPGNGNIDFSGFFNALREKGFRGTGILEYWRPETFKRDMESLAKSARGSLTL